MIELVNEIYLQREGLGGSPDGQSQLRFAIATAASLIFPFAPHLGAEVYELMTGRRVWEEPWPVAEPALLESDTFELIVQVGGKLRDRIQVPTDAPDEELERLALESAKVRSQIDGKSVARVIVVPGKLVNVVVK